MIFPFELDDFWASVFIFRGVSGLFSKDFHQSEISSYWMGQLEGSFTPAGPWRAHFVGCHEYRLITTKASVTLNKYAWVVNADGEEHVLRCPPMSRLENWIPLFGYWLIFKLWVAKAAITCPWKKGQQGKFVFVHHETSLKWWIWWCRYLSPHHHTIWCILMAWRYANAEEGPTCKLQPKTSILGLKGCYPVRKRGEKDRLPTSNHHLFQFFSKIWLVSGSLDFKHGPSLLSETATCERWKRRIFGWRQTELFMSGYAERDAVE